MNCSLLEERKTYSMVQLRIVKRKECGSRNNNRGAIVGQRGIQMQERTHGLQSTLTGFLWDSGQSQYSVCWSVSPNSARNLHKRDNIDKFTH